MKKKFVATIMTCVMLMLCFGLAVPAFAANPGLDAATKKAYYEQYVEIAKEVSKETELSISVLPMEEFAEEDWRTPDDFRKIITEIANWNLVCNEKSDVQTYSRASATKSTTVSADSKTFTLSITGSFETQLHPVGQRQVFSRVNSITSSISGRIGTWKQIGYESTVIDRGRTMAVTVSGQLTVAGVQFNNKLASVEFYCNENGVIS